MKKYNNLFSLILNGLYEFIFGQIIAYVIYDKRYIKGKYFRKNRFGFLKIGWGWALADFNARVWLKINRGVPFPISPRNHINNPTNIHFDVEDLLIFQGQGKYFQAVNAPIYIGKGTYIADNVGIISTNHDIKNLKKHDHGETVKIGENNWIGMNSVILPGVTLGDNTIVGAGSVVTKSFAEGNCIIVGNPAKMLRKLD